MNELKLINTRLKTHRLNANLNRGMILLVMGATLVLSACAPANAAPTTNASAGQTAQSAVKTARVERGSIRVAVTATGNVVPAAQSALSLEIPGTIVELPVVEGQHVEKGQLLARVDDTTQKAALEQAEYAVEAAQSTLNRLLQPVDARDVANAEANVKSAQGTYSAIAGAVSPAMVKAAQLNADKANAAVQSATDLRNGAGGQLKSDDPNYQKTVAGLALAQTSAEIAALKLQQVKNGQSLLQATAMIAYSQAKLAVVKAGPRQIDIDDAQVQLATAQVMRDQAKHVLDKTRLYTPYTGTLSKVNVRLSEGSQAPAMILTDESTLYIDAQVNETDIAKIAIGQPVEMTLEALSGTTLTGKVQRINQFANPTPGVVTYTVRVALDKANTAVKVGMTANATFVILQTQNVLRLPNEYLSQDSDTNQFTVMKANPDGTYSSLTVQVGAQGPSYTEIVSGLNEGDTVVLPSDINLSNVNTAVQGK